MILNEMMRTQAATHWEGSPPAKMAEKITALSPLIEAPEEDDARPPRAGFGLRV